MRVATAAQMAAVDRATIAAGTSGLELMERAGEAMCTALLREFPGLRQGGTAVVCCGKGNNGGDGLVLARLLAAAGTRARVQLPPRETDLSPDAEANLARLPDAVDLVRPSLEEAVATWEALQAEADVVVDAIFGTGVRPPLRGEDARLIAAFGKAGAPVVSLDIPSGVAGDDGAVDPVAVRASLTLTVGLPKLGLLLHPGRGYAGRIEVLDIGFPPEICAARTDRVRWLSRKELGGLCPARAPDLHKYAAGAVLVLAGSRGCAGAPLLATLGALRSGAGLVALALPAEHAGAAAAFVPEALIEPLPTGPGGGLAALPEADLDRLLERCRAWAVGPGLGTDRETDAWLVRTLPRSSLPLVVDADGLSAFARAGVEPRFEGTQAVLTPHAGELARLAGVDARAPVRERLEIVPELARRWGAVLVAKGAPTLVADPEGGVTINGSGHDALAVGGTGDVLTGLIGGLLAQEIPAGDAAVLGCWLHGRAGELAAAAAGSRRGILAREVADALPAAVGELEDGE